MPYLVEESFSGDEGEDTEIEFKDCVDRAFEIAYEVALACHETQLQKYNL